MLLQKAHTIGIPYLENATKHIASVDFLSVLYHEHASVKCLGNNVELRLKWKLRDVHNICLPDIAFIANTYQAADPELRRKFTLTHLRLSSA